jgi:hypothetical protein
MRITSRSLLTAVAVFTLPATLLGQNDLVKYFPAGQTNAGVLVENYVRPMIEDWGAAMNSGWYTSGRVHKKAGFDISFQSNSVFYKEDRQYYSFPSGLSGLTHLGPVGEPGIPTAYGPENLYPEFGITGGGNAGVSFYGPEGLEPGSDVSMNVNFVPTLQAGIGLVKGTDLRVRFTPNLFSFSDADLTNWGVGVMHDIKQHIPGLDKVPVVDLAVFVGYTKLNSEVDLSGEYAGSNQVGDLSSSGITAQVIGGVTLAKVLSAYVSLGYAQWKSDFDVMGDYFVDRTGFGPPGGGPFPGDVALPAPFTLTDPYSYSFEGSGLRMSAGARLKLGPFFLDGEYALAEPSDVITFGLGFTFK